MYYSSDTRARKELSIAADLTASDRQPATPVDPQASLRVKLLGKLLAAEREIAAAILSLRMTGDAEGLGQAETSLADLAALRGEIATTDGPGLVSRRDAVLSLATGAVSETQRRVQQATAQAEAHRERELAEARAASRQQVDRIIAGMKDFDPYLTFTSKEDEDGYRQREAKRLAYIQSEQAKGTLDGDLNAARATADQMRDAKAHGAGAHPDFDRRWNQLELSTNRLEDTARATAEGTKVDERRTSGAADDLDMAMAALQSAGVSTGGGEPSSACVAKTSSTPLRR